MPRYELNKPATPDRNAVNPFTRQPLVIKGRPGKKSFWEVERRGRALHEVSGDLGTPGKKRSKTYATEEAATRALDKATRLYRRRGYVQVGASRELEAAPGAASADVKGSAILAGELFATAEPRFVEEVLRLDAPDALAGLAARWYEDPRPFARTALLTYVDDGCDRAGHKALVKRLFKLAEKAGDDEAMAHFLVAFDRLSRRSLTVVRSHWNPSTRELEPIKGLRHDPGALLRLKEGEKSERFTIATRTYLARRAFRYFRRLGHADVARYGRAIRVALPLYADEHTDKPERLLDAWGLMHVLYGYAKVLDKAPHGLRPADGKSLAALAPAPYFPAAWEGIFDELFAMLTAARSRTVRAWAIAWLRAKYPAELRGMAVARLRPLLASAHDELQRFGGELLESAQGLEALPVADWLALLATPSLDAVRLVCEAVKKHVAPSRLSLEQCIALACAQAAPVAELGLAWAREKKVASEAELSVAVGIARAGVAGVRTAGVAWYADVLRKTPAARAERVRDLCDARFADVRAVGLALLEGEERFREELSLWLALTESPYADVRAFVLAHAARWRARATPATLVHVWTTALLAIHGGAAAKRHVPRAIAERVAAHPGEADALLPLLALALRSVRREDRAFGLAAIARAQVALPELRAAVARHLPELTVSEAVTA